MKENKKNSENSLFISQLKKANIAASIEITNTDTINDIRAIGGSFKIQNTNFDFFYSESNSFNALNIRAAYRFNHEYNFSEGTLLRLINNFNNENYGLKAYLKEKTNEYFDIELSTDATYPSGFNGELPIKILILFIDKGRISIFNLLQKSLQENKNKD